MPKRKTPEQYLQECKKRGLDLPIEDYRGSGIKINHKCSKGHVYKQKPNDHLRGIGCSYCNKKKKKTPEEYYNECKSKGYDLPIEDYVNATTKIKHKCNKGHIYEQTPAHHLEGIGCSYCANNRKKTPEEYLQECREKGYDLPIEDYVNNSTKIKHKCRYDHIYCQKPNDHLRGIGCPICGKKKTLKNCKGKNRKKTSQEYYKECKEKGYDLPLEDYRNNRTKIKHICNKCGNIYYQRPFDHLRNIGCSYCNESHGERFIGNYLDTHNIKYIPQKKFKDLKDKNYLSYDFYLPEYNTLIEYQGQQHYEPIKFNGKNNSNFEKQQLHDKLKREYAKNNGYKLLELKYTLDTQELVNKYLSRRIK